MRAVAWLELVLGLGIVAVTLYDVFQAVVVPRWTSDRFRFSPFLIGGLWLPWRALGVRLRSPTLREDFLAAYAPLVLPTLLGAWALSLVLGFGIALHALRADTRPPVADLGTAWYLAGVCLFTLGFGEITPESGLARVVTVAASASGMALVALVISLLFNIHGAFQRREILVLMLDSRAGAPASGVALLESYGWLKMRDELPAFFRSWENWTADVLESHRAFPVLPYFRSSQGRQSWMAALEAVLDAATLLQTTVDDGPQGAAYLMHQLGTRAVTDLGARRGLESVQDVEVSRDQFDVARRRLALAGYPLRDADESWHDFAASRRQYAGPLTALSRYFGAPPADWLAGPPPTEQHPTPATTPEADTEQLGAGDSATPTCKHLNQIREVEPSTRGCEECMALGDPWVHLRLCRTCGHVGCCDSSKNRHATAHFHATGHPIIRSMEAGEEWSWCFLDEIVVEASDPPDRA